MGCLACVTLTLTKGYKRFVHQEQFTKFRLSQSGQKTLLHRLREAKVDLAPVSLNFFTKKAAGSCLAVLCSCCFEVCQNTLHKLWQRPWLRQLTSTYLDPPGHRALRSTLHPGRALQKVGAKFTFKGMMVKYDQMIVMQSFHSFC